MKNKIKLFILTTNLNDYNRPIIKKINENKNFIINGIYCSESFNGDLGLLKKTKRLLSYGFLNLIKIFFQFINLNKNKLFTRKKNIIINKEILFNKKNGFIKTLNEINRNKVDLVLLIYFNKVIPENYLNKSIPYLNIHPGKLPENRGIMTAFWTLHDMDQYGYITLHQVDKGIDTGPIISELSFKVEERSLHSLMLDMSKMCSEVICEWLIKFINGSIKPEYQNDIKSGYRNRPNKKDIYIMLKQNRFY